MFETNPEVTLAVKRKTPPTSHTAHPAPASRATIPWLVYLIVALPLLMMLWVWLSPLAFVPVPWPDDSAFYFVGKHLFSWPPKWVMISQSPFEPTYREWNFNTMPLFPVMIGLGRLLGIDGSFGIKFWSLVPWAVTGAIAAFWVGRLTRSRLFALTTALLFACDPIHRWGAVIVRPESFIAMLGVILVFGIGFGFKKEYFSFLGWHSRFTKIRYDAVADPIAVLLALGAYAHFNAIILLFPVVAAYWKFPKRLFAIAARTALYLVPWLATVALHPRLFIHQMATQWRRLDVGNDWLDNWDSFLSSLIPSYGSPEQWPEEMKVAAVILAVVLISALVAVVILMVLDVIRFAQSNLQQLAEEAGMVEPVPVGGVSSQIHLTRPVILPATAWVFATAWLWHTKPEVWFVYYIHIACWTLVSVVFVRLARLPGRGVRIATALPFLLLAALFMNINVGQARRMSEGESWKWGTYREFVKCIEDRLSAHEQSTIATRGGAPFKVWGPTFPDVLIELSLKHPSWEYTRTCDFMERVPLALAHGRDVDAMVVTESLQFHERRISDEWAKHPSVHSVWMDWNAYYLNQFMGDPGFKPTRYLCQQGRWMAFIFLK